MNPRSRTIMLRLVLLFAGFGTGAFAITGVLAMLVAAGVPVPDAVGWTGVYVMIIAWATGAALALIAVAGPATRWTRESFLDWISAKDQT